MWYLRLERREWIQRGFGGAGEESGEDLGGEEVADVGAVYGGSQVRPRT